MGKLNRRTGHISQKDIKAREREETRRGKQAERRTRAGSEAESASLTQVEQGGGVERNATGQVKIIVRGKEVWI